MEEENESNFLLDEEKMKDFKRLSKKDFLKSYSYLTKKEYEETLRLYSWNSNQ